MLTPSYLDTVSDDVVLLYAAFEMSILKDIARRINKMDYLTYTARFQAQQLIESGAVFNDVVTKIAKMTNKSVDEVAATFETASLKSLRFDNAVYTAAGLSPIPIVQSNAMIQILNANILKTNNNLANLTMTTASTSQQLFIRATSLAHMQVQSGAFSSDQAIKNAVKLAAREGTTVLYPTGAKRSIESAVRSNVLTGVNQTSGALQDYNMDELGVNLVETSSHAGAREGEGYKGHINWQGKVFMRKGSSAKYKNLYTETGLGTKLGLLGINCKHSYYPFFEGISYSALTQEMFESQRIGDVTYKGKKYTYYEATQKQRYHERQIRRWKREAQMMEAADKDPAFAEAKVRQWQKRSREFVKATGVKRDYRRERIAS